MGDAAPLLRLLLAAAANSVQQGTFVEIIATIAKLLRLVEPLIVAPPASEPEVQTDPTVDALSLRPARPEDAAMARQGQAKPGGR